MSTPEILLNSADEKALAHVSSNRKCYIPIGGTRAWNDRGVPKLRWWQKHSDFAAMMESLGVDMLDAEQPFVWTTDLNGVQFWRRWKIFLKSEPTPVDHRDWVSGGENFLRYCDSVRGPVPYHERHVITHSHGFQVWAYAAKFGLRCRRLISIAPPFRHDMEDVIRAARLNVEQWLLIIDEDSDSVASLGAMGDGILRGSRIFDVDGCRPDKIVRIKGIEHSRILEDRLILWKELNICDFLS